MYSKIPYTQYIPYGTYSTYSTCNTCSTQSTHSLTVRTVHIVHTVCTLHTVHTVHTYITCSIFRVFIVVECLYCFAVSSSVPSSLAEGPIAYFSQDDTTSVEGHLTSESEEESKKKTGSHKVLMDKMNFPDEWKTTVEKIRADRESLRQKFEAEKERLRIKIERNKKVRSSMWRLPHMKRKTFLVQHSYVQTSPSSKEGLALLD